MSNDFCMDCGMLLSPNSSICSVCGFDNKEENDPDLFFDAGMYAEERYIPENHPGF